jgi:hypothetical protein
MFNDSIPFHTGERVVIIEKGVVSPWVVALIHLNYEGVRRQIEESVQRNFGIEEARETVTTAEEFKTIDLNIPRDPLFGKGLSGFRQLAPDMKSTREYTIVSKEFNHVRKVDGYSITRWRLGDAREILGQPWTILIVQRSDFSREWARDHTGILWPFKISGLTHLVTETEIRLVDNLEGQHKGLIVDYFVPYPAYMPGEVLELMKAIKEKASAEEKKRCQGAFKILVQQVVKRMSRTVPVENFPWPIVEQRLHAFDLAPRDAIEPSASREELAQQPVGVLIRAPLPGALGMSKVHSHLRLLGEEPMFPHLLALVVCEGAAELRGQRTHFAGERAPHGRGILGRQRHQQREPGGAFYERPQRRGIGMADEQIALPMARHRASGDLGRSFVDTNDVLNRARRAPYLAWPAKPVPTTKVPGQLAFAGKCPVRVSVMGQHRALRGFFDEWTS